TGVMREGPGSFFPVVKTLESGTVVGLEETRGNWVRGRVGEVSGWIAQLTFEGVSAGVDYSGMIHSEKAVVISSVDIAAASKGLFEANYAESHKVDFARVDALEQLQLPPSLVSSIVQSLPPTNPRLLQGLPAPVFANNVIIRQDAEQLLGRALTATLLSAGFVDTPDTIAYVNAVAAVVGSKTPRYDITFRVALTADDGINGFGLPGGNVVISRGLLNKVHSEAELACQIGHEIAHVTLYHGLREFQKRSTHRLTDSGFDELNKAVSELAQSNSGDGTKDDPFAELNGLTGDTSQDAVEANMTRVANTSYLTIIGKRARADELEADLYGAAYAAAAGYDPQAMITYLERVRDDGVGQDTFRHHPAIQDRIEALRDGIRRYRLVAGRPVLHTERFMEQTARLRGLKEGM
ncbi:MAG TPA: hypothetical protein DCS43_12870, partial [Verrucomicrobia bacterium]|nr:hypothetical protein [Verrucomicrobiota bacterium]